MGQNELDLEFSLLVSLIKGESSVVSDSWDLIWFDDGVVLGRIYFKPVDCKKFLNLEVLSSSESGFKARLKPFYMVQEEFDYQDFSESEITENEKRLIVFLLFHHEYVDKLEKKLREKLSKRL